MQSYEIKQSIVTYLMHMQYTVEQFTTYLLSSLDRLMRHYSLHVALKQNIHITNIPDKTWNKANEKRKNKKGTF